MNNTGIIKILLKAWNKILKEQIEILHKIDAVLSQSETFRAENPEQEKELTVKFLELYTNTTRIHKAIHAIKGLK